MARHRRTFGPLLYTTLVFALIATAYTGLVTFEQGYVGQSTGSAILDPADEVARWGRLLKDAKWETRMQAVNEIAKVLRGAGSSDRNSGFRQEALDALRIALSDAAAPVRASAGEALGIFPAFGRQAKAELTAALRDDDPTVRLAACHALIAAGESVPLVVESYASVVAEFLPKRDRLLALGTLASVGQPGASAAADVLLKLLASRDHDRRAAGLDCLAGLGAAGPLVLARLGPLFDADDVGVRCSAALAVLELSSPAQPSNPRAVAILEQVVLDPSLPIDLRERALTALLATAVPLRPCGLALAKQLTEEDRDVRWAAATLLRMIDAESIAGPAPPVATP
jgi:HEAT repeats